MFRRSYYRLLSLLAAKSFLGLPTPTTTVTPSKDGNHAGSSPSQKNTGEVGAGSTSTTHRVFPSFSSSTASSRPPLAIQTLLEILKSHYLTPDETLLSTALEQVVVNDRSSLDSALVALCRVPISPEEVKVENGSSFASTTHSTSLPTVQTSTFSTQNVVVQLMQRYPACIRIQECGCRCIANMCLLSLPSDAAPPAKVDVAEELVQDGALEAVLRAISLGNRLSRRGQGWGAMALLNLLCLSQTGAVHACRSSLDFSSPAVRQRKGEGLPHEENIDALRIISTFITTLLDEKELWMPTTVRKIPLRTTKPSSFSSSSSFPSKSPHPGDVPTPSSLSCFPADLVTAVDAAVGALTILLQQDVPENTKGIRVWSEAAPFPVMKAICQSLLLCSLLLVRDGRNDGVYSASLPKRREGVPFQLHKCSSHQSTAIITLLPWMHKNWMAMRQLCRHPANLPFLWEAFRAVLHGDEKIRNKSGKVADVKRGQDVYHKEGNAVENITESMKEEREVNVEQHKSGEASISDEKTEKTYEVCLEAPLRERGMSSSLSLDTMIEASLFVLTELEGLDKVQHLFSALVQIHKEIGECIMEVFSRWTELPSSSFSTTTTGCEMEMDRAAAGIETRSSAGVLPTISSRQLRVETMRSGTISSLALATVVRVHADLCETRRMAARHYSPSSRANVPTHTSSSSSASPYPSLFPYDLRQHAMLLRALETLHHLTTVRYNAQTDVQQETIEKRKKEGEMMTKKDISTACVSVTAAPDSRTTITVDDVAMSLNTVAALQVILQTGATVLFDIIAASSSLSSSSFLSLPSLLCMSTNDVQRQAFIEELSYLFEHRSSSSATSENERVSAEIEPEEKKEVLARREAQSQLLLQEAAVLGQVSSILYSFLQVEKGARILMEATESTSAQLLKNARGGNDTDMEKNTKDSTGSGHLHRDGIVSQVLVLQHVLDNFFGEALKKAKTRFAEKETASGSTTAPSSWPVTRVEETVICLTEVLRGLLKSLQGLQAISSKYLSSSSSSGGVKK